MTKTKNKSLIVKLVFGLALLLFIGWKVSSSLGREDFGSLSLSDNGTSLFVLVFVLMAINWLIESLKWHLLVRQINPQSFGKTFLDVLAGVSTSLITPNRIGNFIGRTTKLEKGVRTKAVIATIHSNLAQFIASILFGTLALLYLGFENKLIDESAVQFSAFAVIGVGFLLFLYPKVIDFNPISRLFSEQMKQGMDYIQNESIGLKLTILLLSLFRYSIFLIQFYLLLIAFNAFGEIEVLVPAIALVYLITTVIPSFLFGKLFVREASALFVLEAYGVQTPVILAAVFILWMINLAIPAVLGAAVLMKR